MTDEKRPRAETSMEGIEAAWPVPEPDVEFAAGVLAAHFSDAEAGTRTDTRTPRRQWAWGGAVAAVLLVLGLVWALHGGGTIEDQLDAHELETVALGDRATAVAQPGTKMKWSVDSDGTTRIDQRSGRVFYRVDHGERFDVVTPRGTVTVTGTCFEVDLEPPTMKTTNVRAGALGAALASALVVTVYEGGVVLANDHGSVDLAAGDSGRVSDARAPVRFDPDGDDHRDSQVADTQLVGKKAGDIAGDPMAHIARQARDIDRIREEKNAQAARIQELEGQVIELGGAIDPKSPQAAKARAKMCASQSRGGTCPFLEPDQDTLMEMARCATVKIDSLGFVDNPEPPSSRMVADRLGVTDPAEAKKLHAAATAQYDRYNDALREMYLELGGDETTAEDASGKTLESFIFDQLDQELVGDIQRRIAQERAGVLQPPTDRSTMSIEERVSRMRAETGNDFERLVGDSLGEERARELRRKHDGWPGSTSVHSGDCVDPAP
ncbi:MAG: hypothetical protein ACRBN8_10105 [Nannocystales bacterium]